MAFQQKAKFGHVETGIERETGTKSSSWVASRSITNSTGARTVEFFTEFAWYNGASGECNYGALGFEL